jgi:hypothetical protein
MRPPSSKAIILSLGDPVTKSKHIKGSSEILSSDDILISTDAGKEPWLRPAALPRYEQSQHRVYSTLKVFSKRIIFGF